MVKQAQSSTHPRAAKYFGIVGGSDVCENVFSQVHCSNSRPTGKQAKSMIAQHAGFRGADGRTFTQIVKSNSNRDDLVDLTCLNKQITRTRVKLEQMAGRLNGKDE